MQEIDVTLDNPTVITTPQATGRRLVKFKDGVALRSGRALLEKADVEVATVRSADAASSIGGGSVYFPDYGIAIIDGSLSKVKSASEMLKASDEVDESRPEFWMYAVQGPPWTDTAASTWGIDAVGAANTSLSGAGIKVAVLDTGIDTDHADFDHKSMVTESFVAGESVEDIQGHGTHCAGTVCGQAKGGNVPRYGIAPSVRLFVGKVLNNRGAGREGDIIAGMIWAIENGCEIISMSLGRPVAQGEPVDPLYESVASDALKRGTLIVAASGNDSDRRWGYVAPVSAPANCPSIMAVAAIGADGRVANFSNGGRGVGDIAVAAPGVGVFSAYPGVQAYRNFDGTSMACPHVAGVAALVASGDPHLRGEALRKRLVGQAKRLADSKVHVGAGLAVVT